MFIRYRRNNYCPHDSAFTIPKQNGGVIFEKDTVAVNFILIITKRGNNKQVLQSIYYML
ncbi:MAG: hypothetical protein MJ132_00595 [Clostridia bacterium]|nr:hypothetical protein [Clostridia bacterium]